MFYTLERVAPRSFGGLKHWFEIRLSLNITQYLHPLIVPNGNVRVLVNDSGPKNHTKDSLLVVSKPMRTIFGSCDENALASTAGNSLWLTLTEKN